MTEVHQIGSIARQSHSTSSATVKAVQKPAALNEFILRAVTAERIYEALYVLPPGQIGFLQVL